MGFFLGKSVIAERVHNFGLVCLSAWGTSVGLVWIHRDLIRSDNGGHDQTREVFSRETRLDEACAVVYHEVLLLVKEDLHLLQAFLDSSHFIVNLFEL